jgi:chromosome partitioning protein
MSQATQATIITVFNEKGGSGKTTTACQLAGTLGRRGFDVLVADLDAQGTASQWLSAEEGANFKATLWSGSGYKGGVTSEMSKLALKYEIIVADCAPSVDQPSTWGMLLISDLILIPTKLSPPDISALSTAKKLARKAIEAAGRSIPVRVIPTAARMHLADDKQFVELLRLDKEFPPLSAHLSDRKPFSRSMLAGTTTHGLGKGAEEATREIEALTDQVLKVVKLHGKAKR